MSKIENAVAKQLLLRAKIGEKKYGTTMERNDLSLKEWLQHLQEEILDAAVYIEKLKQEIQYQEFELAEKRMEIIGRNGNTGEHYDDIAQVRHNDSKLDVDDETWACNTHPFQD